VAERLIWGLDLVPEVAEELRAAAVGRSGVSPTRSFAWSRPVAIPEDIDDPSITKASGKVELPRNVRWSPPFRSYDLADPTDRLSVYAQVMTEGNEDDVRRFIDPSWCRRGHRRSR
jgi:hypothetical protein